MDVADLPGVDQHGLSGGGQGEHFGLRGAEFGPVGFFVRVLTAGAVARKIAPEERQFGVLETFPPVLDHRAEQCGIAVRRSGIAFALVPDHAAQPVGDQRMEPGIEQQQRQTVPHFRPGFDFGFFQCVGNQTFQRFETHPAFDPGAALCRFDQADRTDLVRQQFLAEEISDGGEKRDRRGFGIDPAAPAVRLRFLGGRIVQQETAEPFSRRIFLFFVQSDRAGHRERHVGLSGTEPDFADQHVLHGQLIDFQFERTFRGVGEVEIDPPASVFSGRGLGGVPVEGHRDFFARRGGSEHRHFRPARQHGMIGKDRRQFHFGIQDGAGEQHGGCKQQFLHHQVLLLFSAIRFPHTVRNIA